MDLESYARVLPKAELHVHIEGTPEALLLKCLLDGEAYAMAA